MSETVSVGGDWYVLEDICGMLVAQYDPDGTLKRPVTMLMRGGHILTMTGLDDKTVAYIRTRRDPQPDSPTPPVAEFEPVSPGNAYELQQANPAVTDVDMAPAEDIST